LKSETSHTPECVFLALPHLYPNSVKAELGMSAKRYINNELTELQKDNIYIGNNVTYIDHQ